MSLIKVKYVGVSNVRSISKKEFADAGVVIDKDVTWDIRNRYTVVLDANEKMEEVLRDQGHFTISTADDAGKHQVVATASNPDVEAGTLVDGNTGAKTASKTATVKSKP